MSKKTKKLYIRFNEIPEDGHSFIYDENNIVCGKRDGVSVYDAVKVDGVYTPILPRYASKETINEFHKYTYDNTSGKYEKMYLVTGDLVATDERHCPIITNVEVLDTLNFDEVFPGRRLTPDITPATTVEEETQETPVNRVDEFVNNVVETADQIKSEIKAAANDASEDVRGFVEEVRTSQIYNNTSEKIKGARMHISRFARAAAAFTKVMLETKE